MILHGSRRRSPRGTYARGDQLLGDGARTESFLLARGAVRLVRAAPDGRVLGLGLLAEGSVFGHLPFAQVKAEERAEALAESRVLHVLTRDLERIAQGCPPVAAKLLAEVGTRLGDASERLVGVAFQSVPARLASILLELADRYGRVTPAWRAHRPAAHPRPARRARADDPRDAHEGRRLAARRGHRHVRAQRALDRRPRRARAGRARRPPDAGPRRALSCRLSLQPRADRPSAAGAHQLQVAADRLDPQLELRRRHRRSARR